MSDQALLDSKRVGTFDGLQESIHSRGPLKGEHQQVNMFGHAYERSQSPAVSLHRGVDGSGEHLTPGIIGQQRHSAVTRKGQLPSVRWVLIVLDRLAMPLSAYHATHSYGGVVLKKQPVSRDLLDTRAALTLLGKPAVAPGTRHPALGNVTTTVYDDVGRVSAAVNPLGYRTTNIYDAAGQIVAVHDANAKRTTAI